VDADGTVLAAMQVPHVIDPGEGASSSYTFEQLFGAANLPQPVVALVEVEPVELPPERAGGVGPPLPIDAGRLGKRRRGVRGEVGAIAKAPLGRVTI
jgi:hypothetical protein